LARFDSWGEAVGFVLIGGAVMACAIGALGSTAGPEVAQIGPAAVEEPFVAYDVEVLDLLPAPLDDEEPPIPVEEPELEVEAVEQPIVAVAMAEEAVPERAEAPRPPEKRVASRKVCTQAADPGIVPRGEGAWTVQDEVIQRYTRHWNRLEDLGWSAPHRGPDGKSVGLRIGGIRCGSDPWDAGFRNGDVIHAVNGRAVRTLPQAVLVYGAIHGDRVFEVEITRRGERRVLRYRLAG
jgi:hypothetical protein